MGGQSISHPFQMVDVEFTPGARAESVHALDRVDLGSVPGLREGAVVPVTYPLADPRAGWMSIGTRDYGRRAWTYILALTYGIGAVVAFLVFPAVYAVLRLPPIVAISRVLSAAGKKES